MGVSPDGTEQDLNNLAKLAEQQKNQRAGKFEKEIFKTNTW